MRDVRSSRGLSLRGLSQGLFVLAVMLGALAALVPAALAATPSGNAGDRVVLVGVPGLRWGDVKPHATPVLWRLAGQGGIANIAVRGVQPRTCAAEGWLTISAGGRARPVEDGCADPPRPVPHGAGAAVEGHRELREHNASTVYGSQVGLLGDSVKRAGGCTAAAGPGAALAAADLSGRVDHYRDGVPSASWDGWRRCAVTAVDIDDLVRQDGGRRAALGRADRKIGEVLGRVPQGARVLIVGVADVGHPGLRVTIDTGGTAPEGARAGYLTGASTRRDGLLALTDVTPTVLGLAGVPVPERLVGSPWSRQVARPERNAAAIERLRERDLAARVARDMVAPFNIALVGGQIVAYGLAALAWRRTRPGRRRQRILTVTRAVALAAAAAPAATYLANLTPWWRAGHPAGGLVAAVVLADLAVLATALAGPWRRHRLGPVLVVAGVTSLTLAADAIAGSVLQADSLNGNFSLAAGRFYGFGNLTFALFATASLICAAGLAGHAAAAGRRRRAVALTVGVGGAAVIVDGWPSWGGDFGGVLALTPGVVLLALSAAGRRMSPGPLLLAGSTGVAAVAVLSFLDARRPPASRSHLGEFWHLALDGGAWPVVQRKADSMLNSLGSVWLTLPVTAVLIGLMAVLLRRDGVLGPAFRRIPALRTALPAVLLTAVLGFAVNDSGIAVPALTALLAVPLTVAAAVAARAPEPG